MANVSEKFGLRPYRKLDGTPLVGAQNRYRIAAGYATAIFQGDLVIPTAAGNVERHTANTSNAVVGVFNGCFYNDPTTQKPTWKNYYPGGVTPTQGGITAFVVDDPDAVFLVDSDGTFSAADLFKNYSVTNTTGVTQTGNSQVQLDYSESGTQVTYVIQAIDISQDPANSTESAANGNILVRINNHFYRQATVGLA
jgi:hypothetical protein|tara:strand:+ start:2357 stop:2944 length:588 start_codon:yes stop_codon:yes gene_type:complete